VPFATVIGHMRNRVYDPFTGRLLQRDMNATGIALSIQVYHSGSQVPPSEAAFAANFLYSDGGSLYAFLAVGPRSRSDPLGLFSGPTSLLDLQIDYAQDVIEIGFNAGSAVVEVANNYSINQSLYVGWALDWKQRDNASSHGLDRPASNAMGMGSISGFGLLGSSAGFGPVANPASSFKNYLHHIFSNKGKRAAKRLKVLVNKFRLPEAEARQLIESMASKIPIDASQHGGSHTKKYHSWVMNKLFTAMEGKTGTVA